MDAAAAVKRTRVSLNIDKTRAGCLSSVNPGVGAAGAQADSTFHPESQPEKKNKPMREDVGTHCKNGGPLQLVIHFFCERCHFMRLNSHACESLLTARGGCWDWLSESRFILILCLWMSTHT